MMAATPEAAPVPAFTFNLQLVDGSNASARLSPTVTQTEEFLLAGVVIPASSTNYLVAGSFAFAKVSAVWLYCDAACTLKTNSSGSPAQTFTLAANVPLLWLGASDPRVNPFTADVTAFYVTCSAGGNLYANIQLAP